MTAKHFVTLMADEWRILDDEENVVAIVPDEANANLFLAAPDLLAALETLVTKLHFDDEEGLAGYAEPMIAARLAIAKARGQR